MITFRGLSWFLGFCNRSIIGGIVGVFITARSSISISSRRGSEKRREWPRWFERGRRRYCIIGIAVAVVVIRLFRLIGRTVVCRGYRIG